jgi:hypothetical protein
MPTYRVTGTINARVSLHVEAHDDEAAKLGLLMLSQRILLTRLDDEAEVGDFTWTDVAVEPVEPVKPD